MIKKSLPWWLKIFLKIIINKIPISYDQLGKLHILQHGNMHDPEQAIRTFNYHFNKIFQNDTDFVLLESGPGNSVASGILAWARGAKKSYLVDAGFYATKNLATYTRLIKEFKKRNLLPEDAPEVFNTFEELLDFFHITYLTNGTKSLSDIPQNSVDYCISHVVIEHIYSDEIKFFFDRLKKVTSKKGLHSHTIDLRDHLSNALNNLRFSKQLWESQLFKTSGFYTNRLQCADLLDIINKSGFNTELTRVEKWEKIPTPQKSFHYEFQVVPAEKLLIKEFDIILSVPN